MPQDHYPVLLALGIALALGLVLQLVSALASRRMGGRVSLDTYESGEPLLDRSHKRISVLFFLIAIDFVVFDVEAAFLFPWAVVLRELGFIGLIEVVMFVLVLVVGLVYAWKKGVLEWVS